MERVVRQVHSSNVGDVDVIAEVKDCRSPDSRIIITVYDDAVSARITCYRLAVSVEVDVACVNGETVVAIYRDISLERSVAIDITASVVV